MIVKRERILHVFPSKVLLERAWHKELEELKKDVGLNPYVVSELNRTIRLGLTTYELTIIKTMEDVHKHAGRFYTEIVWHYEDWPNLEYTKVRSALLAYARYPR